MFKKLSVFALSAALLSAPAVQAAKENFDRSKPHLNIGVAIDGQDFGEVVAMSGLGLSMAAKDDESKGVHYSDITLKRGYTGNDNLKKWAEESARSGGECPTCRRSVTVKILSPSGEVVRTFNAVDVVPLSWALSSVATEQGDLLTETITIKPIRLEVM